MELWAIWLIVAAVLLVIEMMTLTFYLLWIAIGAVVAAALALFVTDSFVWQVLPGCAVVLVLTTFTKPITRYFRSSKGFSDAVDELVGKPGIVLEPAEEGKPGIVKVGNETWSAVSITGEPLAQGDTVVVVERGSATLRVDKWKGEV
ncbi:NfeD family protein [Paenibacillus ginsengarvi]|uniref:NfeD family protein n=1 Tax=Paenibacillus ginsengarvi TaxID=400777 RepID=A0A3B0C088_9BACL|nr:NfeD family protein [Paenibacillus ginsengarvi]RKN79215.1 NfeD family protein [Paenibacillus ginsengarvi]